MKYYQLNTRTSFNMKESTILVDEYAERGSELSYSGLAVCDRNLFAFPSFAKACQKKKIQGIFGYECDVSASKTMPLKACLYIKNEQGYLNLCKLLSAKREVFSLNDLAVCHDGLIFVLETNPDYFTDLYLTTVSPDIIQYRKIFQDDFYIGISLYSSLDQEEAKILYRYCQEHEYRPVAFPKCLYIHKSDAYKTNVLAYAQRKEKVPEDVEKEGPYFLLSPKSLSAVYREQDLATAEEIASKCQFAFFQKRGHLISFKDDNRLLKEKAETGLKQKLSVSSIPENYQARLDYELDVIKNMEFSSYFLIVDDYVHFARTANIEVGPGRGSAGGSLVAYALNITQIDPLKYDLTFERFLNPNRKTMPDIDIDFEDTRRDEIVNYLRNRYGESNVADIVTFVQLKPRSCLNLIGPALNFNEARLKKLTQSINEKSETFEDAIQKQKGTEFTDLYKDPYYQSICDLAKGLLGVTVNTSIHAAGVILSDKPIALTCPRKEGRTGTVLYEYPNMEEMGFLKVDILSLSNLSFIKKIESKIKANGKLLPDVYSDLDNPEVYKVLNQKDLVEIFQLDTSYGMAKTIETIKPNGFHDIAAVLALFRPGPMDYIDTYAKRKHGEEKIVYADERLKPILEETYGIFVYQEQIMKAVTAVARFSLGEADLFRRAISKKDISKMEAYKGKFLLGCKNNGIDNNRAEKIFSDIEKFAQYGFNKAHAYEYSLIAYKLLYYKTFYPQEFYSTSLEKESLSSPKGDDILKELKERNLHLRNPNINLSEEKDFVFRDNDVYLPLSAIPGNNQKLIQKIISARKEKEFVSFYDFALRMDGKIDSNEHKAIVTLIDAGAFDKFSKSRVAMKANLENYFGYAHFGMNEDQIPPLTDDGEDIGEMLYLEKMAIGRILSCRLYKIFTDRNAYTGIVSDISALEMANQITVETENKTYKIKLKKKEDFKKFDFVLLKGFLPYRKSYVDDIDVVNCQRKVVKHG